MSVNHVSEELPVVSYQKIRLRIVIIAGVILLFSFMLVGFFNFQIIKDKQSVQQKIKEALLASPTPFPFRELTIPALRARSYKSSLSALTLYENAGSYTSYLTSYNSF